MTQFAEPAAPNRLIRSSSPYLRQHAHNPVDWYPWGREALERARREDRPILLSVGYSACHWCHVMAHECFEDPEIARLMNDHFVCIKVDREERPDIDQPYQIVSQLLTGQGGWPLTVFLTPELEPFYAGTYFPPTPRYGRPGFPQVLEGCARAYREKRDEIRRQASRLVEAVRLALDPDPAAQAVGHDGPVHPASSTAHPSAHVLISAAEQLLKTADQKAGGFGGAPKFPHATGLELLLRAAWRFGHTRSLEHLLLSLERMGWGGLFDQAGGGFHRYAIDRWWRVPHFEKMLYDNALLVPLYVRAGMWKRPQLLRFAIRTLDFVVAEMRLEGGGFAASLDADSPDETGRLVEGHFYRWTPEEIRQAVEDDELAGMVSRAFEIGPRTGAPGEASAGPRPGLASDGPPGWIEEARSVLGRTGAGLDEAAAGSAGASQAGPGIARLDAALSRMREYRKAHRKAPARDDKVVLGWHALWISALVSGAQANLDAGGRFRDAAEAGWAFVLERMRHPRLGLLHTPAQDAGEAVPAFADDYAFCVHAALDLYRLTQQRAYLDEADRLSRQARDLFHEEGVYYLSAGHHGSPLARSRDAWDQATPSPNAAMAAAHARLATVLEDPGHLEAGQRIVEAFWGAMQEQVPATAGMWCALDRLDGGQVGVTIEASALDALRQALDRLLAIPHPALEVRWQPGGTGAPRFVVCRGLACEAPTADLESVANRLHTL